MNAHNAYLEGRVLAADPIELVRILYEEALDATRKAIDALRDGRIEDRSQAITRAQLILMELATSLDPERGGDLAANLGELYVYITGRLTQAHVEQKPEPLEEVCRLLATMLEGWQGCRPDATPAGVPAAVAQVGYPPPLEAEPGMELVGHSWVY